MRAAVLFALLATYLAQAKLTNCNNQNNDLGIESISSQAGVVTIRGMAQVDLPKGTTIQADLIVLGVTMASAEIDMCDQVACPIQASSQYTVQVGLLLPGGDASNSAEIKLTSSKTCVKTGMAADNLLSTQSSMLGGMYQIDYAYSQWRQMYPQAVAKYETFVANWQRIVKHNADPKQTYKMAMNEFGGMTTEEFVQARMGVRPPVSMLRKRNARVSLPFNPMVADPPSELDWTELGKQMVSCDLVDGACNGGWMDTGFAWAMRSKGLCTTDSYPYTSGTTRVRGTCDENECEPVEGSVPTGFEDIEPNETSLLAAVALHGPVSVAIQADEYAFQFYTSGVLVDQCSQHLNHGVLLVGYGVSEGENGIKYWKLKNSWGANWGEQGYIRIQRDKEGVPAGGQCGVAKVASYPVYE
ncbi:hypothetical protein BASA81_013769 [Batrachochytrium salamandrivorans]|nr:hypothetical protein BASA81_013769 [Batrachochytrium salamandrivorans]